MSLLSQQSQVNADTAFFAPASGGGGGSGSNLNVSTINVAPNGGIIMNTDAFGDTPSLQFNTAPDGSLNEQFLFRDAQSGNLSDGGRFMALQYYTPSSITGGILGVRGLNFSPQFLGEAGAGVIGVATGGTSIYLDGVSTINGAAPGGGGSVPMNLGVSTLTLNSQPTAAGGTLTVNSIDTNLYNFSVISSNATPVTNFALGTIGGRNQLYANVGQINDSLISSLSGLNSAVNLESDLVINPNNQILGGGTNPNSGASINNFQTIGCGNLDTNALNANYGSTTINVLCGLTMDPGTTLSVENITNVSSINGGPPAPKNVIIPFITGSGDGSLWTAYVPTNTGGAPIQLTSTLTTNPANTYLVSYSLVNGTNTDVTSVTRVKLYTAAADVQMRAYPGDAADFVSASAGTAVSMLVSGASALRLEAGNTSASVSTTLFFDQPNSVRITDLGSG